jgi:hypothetical protein
MPNVRSIAINGDAGAYTVISATQWTWRAEIIEDYSANAGVGQGLQYLVPDPKSMYPDTPNWLGTAGSTGNTAVTAATVGFEVAPQTEPIILGSAVLPLGGGSAPTIGHGPDASGGYTLPATQLIQIRSASATGTTIRITEYP